MTLITRVRLKESSIIAADNQTNNERGDPLISRTGKVITQKLFNIPKLKCGLGVSGFLSSPDFNMIETLKAEIEAENYESIEDLIQNIRSIGLESSCQIFPSDLSIILSTQFDNGEHLAKTFYYDSQENEIVDTIINPGNLYNNGVGILICKFHSIDWHEMYKSFNQDEFAELIDFNFNYVKAKSDNTDEHPCNLYTIFHILCKRIYPEKTIENLKELSSAEIKELLVEFYKYLSDVNDEPSIFRGVNSQLRAIGHCSSILEITDKESRWLHNQ